jgi:hypothetical protein
MTSDPEFMTADEAIAYVMQSQNVSRRNAKRMLAKAISSGKVEATGIMEDKRQTIPPGKNYYWNDDN